jgi:hypothetical protein
MCTEICALVKMVREKTGSNPCPFSCLGQRCLRREQQKGEKREKTERSQLPMSNTLTKELQHPSVAGQPIYLIVGAQIPYELTLLASPY